MIELDLLDVLVPVSGKPTIILFKIICMKVDGLGGKKTVSKWPVPKYQCGRSNGRSRSTKLVFHHSEHSKLFTFLPFHRSFSCYNLRADRPLCFKRPSTVVFSEDSSATPPSPGQELSGHRQTPPQTSLVCKLCFMSYCLKPDWNDTVTEKVYIEFLRSGEEDLKLLPDVNGLKLIFIRPAEWGGLPYT